MNLVRHTQIYLLDSVHSYGSGLAHLGREKVIHNIQLEYGKTDLSCDADFSHVSKFRKKQEIDTGILSGLTAWFLAQDFPLGSGK